MFRRSRVDSVTVIPYVCLLNIPSQRLGALLDKARDQSNAWFEVILKDHNCASGDGDGGHGSVALPVDCAALAPLEGDLSAALLTDSTLPALVEESTMSRVIVDKGPRALAFNVYFDNFTGGGARQRGLVDCHAMGASSTGQSTTNRWNNCVRGPTCGCRTGQKIMTRIGLRVFSGSRAEMMFRL